jgi:predicted nuclease of predicted toxin-antitoxin system
MPCRFKLDENIARDAASLLRQAGHDVRSVFDQNLDGGTDAQIVDVCRAEKRILVTLDLDFADIRLYPPSGHAGVWVLRPSTQSIETTLTVLRGALALLETETAAQRLWILEHDRVRIREE